MGIREEVNVTGTLVWYYFICKREVWLMAHSIEADQDNEFIDIGRFIHETSYQREKKELSLGNIKIDILKKAGEELVVGEVKKSSKFKESARMQLAYYLYELEKKGITAKGILMFPKEKQREEIILNDLVRKELEKTINDILRIMYQDKPQPAQKISFCKNCAYNEFCWA